MRRPTSFDLQV